MNTPSHLLVNFGLMRKKNTPNWPILLGALVPDIPMFVFYLVQKQSGLQEKLIWGSAYFQPHWQNVFDGFHSLVILACIAAVCWHWRKSGLVARFLLPLLASMALHDLLDLPLHGQDGHRHLWPLSSWMFVSPVSYWDPRQLGVVGAGLELLLVMLASWRMFASLDPAWSQILVLGVNLVMLTGYLLFYLSPALALQLGAG